MYEIRTIIYCRTTHQLKKGYVGKCANEHGEFYKIYVTIDGGKLNKYDMLVDFGDIKKLIEDKYDHANINKIPPFDKVNPTAEKIAETIFKDVRNYLQTLDNAPNVISVAVDESEEANHAKYSE